MTTPGPSGVVERIRQDGQAGLRIDADISVGAALGRLAAVQERAERRRAAMWANIHTVPIRTAGLIGLNSASGVLDFPDQLGPHDGYWWDLKNLKLWGWTAGTVTAYLNANDPSAEPINIYNTPGMETWGKAQQPMAPRDRIIIVAAGVTGNVYVGGSATEVLAPYWAEYVT